MISHKQEGGANHGYTYSITIGAKNVGDSFDWSTASPATESRTYAVRANLGPGKFMNLMCKVLAPYKSFRTNSSSIWYRNHYEFRRGGVSLVVTAGQLVKIIPRQTLDYSIYRFSANLYTLFKKL